MEVKRVWTASEIISILEVNPDQVGKALVSLWNRQTEDERSAYETRHANGVGFNGADARILSAYAKFYQDRGYLTEKQLLVARKKIKKYGKQLAAIVNCK